MDRHPHLCRCDDCKQLDDSEWLSRTPVADLAITETGRLVALYVPRPNLKVFTVASWQHHMDDDTCTVEREDFVEPHPKRPNRAIAAYMEAAEIPDNFRFTRNTHPAGGGQ